MSNQAKVLFFATLRDITGIKECTIELLPGMTIADVKSEVIEKFPGLSQQAGMIIMAMNHEFASDDDTVPDKAEIAMFPPVSGGDLPSDTYPSIVAITDKPIDINILVDQITMPTTGAVCSFTGTVRSKTNRQAAHETQSLEYEAYRSMAEEKLWQICAEIRSKWSEVVGIALVQRIGMLKPGEISVVVACSSGHRDEGIFEAAHYGIDRLKEIVPVWKKEISLGGEEWVEGEYLPHKGD